MSGSIEVERAGSVRRFDVAGAPGMQGHIFGRRKPWSWCWVHANAWLDEAGAPVPAVLEAIHVRRSPGAPALTSAYLRLDGRDWLFNRLADVVSHRRLLFAGERVGNQGRELPEGFELERAGEPSLRASFRFLPDEVARVDYLDTDGSRLVNRNGTLAVADLEFRAPGGARRVLHAPGSATLEIVGRG
jgi:hypothetical protein